MSPSFDTAADMSSFDGLETVTLRQPVGAPIVIAGALRRRDACSEAEPADGQYTARDVSWHLPAVGSEVFPAVGDVIADAEGTRFVVQSVERAKLAGRWLCRARALAVIGRLDTTIALQQGTWSKGASGDPIATWRDVRINLPARIEPQATELTIEYDRRLTRVTHRIIVAEDLSIDHTFRIVAAGATYRILGYERSQRIDALGVILTSLTSGAAA